MVEGIKRGLYGDYPKKGANINNFWWEDLLSNRNSNYQISANLVEKRDQEPQNTENWGYPYMGAMPKRGPI